MKRFGALALVAALAAAGGCASAARYAEKKPDRGVVTVPDDSDCWPGYNRRAALKLIEQHVGPDYEIVDQRTVKTGRTGRSGLPDTNETLNPRNPGAPAYRSASTHATSMPEDTQFQITYRRKDAPSGATNTVVPVGGAVRTEYVPMGATPNAQPKSGAVPLGAGGTGSYLLPLPRPGTSGLDCKT